MAVKFSHKKSVILSTILAMPLLCFANERDTEFFRSQQRQQHIEQQLTPTVDVRLDTNTTTTKSTFSLGNVEMPCVVVNALTLSGEHDKTFSFLIPQVVKRAGFKSGMCIGGKGMQQLQTLAQNIVIEQGFITTLVYIADQDLNTGSLNLTLIPGKIQTIRYEKSQERHDNKERLFAFGNTFPRRNDEILNLRDLEQGLENLRRLSTIATDIRIEPSMQEGKSDVIVTWAQSRPFRLNVSMDDSGSKVTGKYQGSLSISIDNPLNLNDLFYISYNRDLGHKTSYTDSSGIQTDSGTNGYSVHYSIPFGTWLWSLNHSKANYHEATEGIAQNYDYNGKSYNSSITANWAIFRNGQHKTTLGGKLWSQQVKKYVDDTEIEVQRRRTAGWMLDLQHRAYWGRFTVDSGISYKRGTGMMRSMKAPEEYNNDDNVIPGTSRMKIVNVNLSITAPFQIGQQLFSFDSDFHAQWNKTPLVQQDKLSIGGRYTVRGFDGEKSLIGERGWYWQNNINWHYLDGHQVYIGLDTGRVLGISTKNLPNQQLTGTVLGFKGAHKVGGVLGYDFFLGKPLNKPNYFRTDPVTYGFSFNYSF